MTKTRYINIEPHWPTLVRYFADLCEQETGKRVVGAALMPGGTANAVRAAVRTEGPRSWVKVYTKENGKWRSLGPQAQWGATKATAFIWVEYEPGESHEEGTVGGPGASPGRTEVPEGGDPV